MKYDKSIITDKCSNVYFLLVAKIQIGPKLDCVRLSYAMILILESTVCSEKILGFLVRYLKMSNNSSEAKLVMSRIRRTIIMTVLDIF